MDQLATTAAAAVSQARQWDRLMEMARIGAIPGHGVNRPCLTEGDRTARRLLIDWATAIGASVSADAAANLWLRVEGADSAAAPVVTGSHMDTQPQGGRFDGIYGVIAGLEVISALHDANIRTRRPIEVVAWTNEEGSRFAPGCMGSMAWAGVHPIEEFADIRDTDGVRFGDALAAQLAAESDLAHRALGSRPHAYVEAHIEQGPVLEAEGKDIGVVTGIQGSRWFTVTIAGETAHAGTSPLGLRKDAVQDMVRAIAALNALMEDPADVLRFTVGRIGVEPNSSNTVANRAVFSIDLRHPDAAVLAARGDEIAATVRSAVRHCTAEVTETFHAQPTAFSPAVVDEVARAAEALGLRSIRIPSGAFHDAQPVSGVCPTGMIFVPCRGGISHNPAEYSSAEQLAAGTRVLAATVAGLAEIS